MFSSRVVVGRTAVEVVHTVAITDRTSAAVAFDSRVVAVATAVVSRGKLIVLALGLRSEADPTLAGQQVAATWVAGLASVVRREATAWVADPALVAVLALVADPGWEAGPASVVGPTLVVGPALVVSLASVVVPAWEADPALVVGLASVAASAVGSTDTCSTLVLASTDIYWAAVASVAVALEEAAGTLAAASWAELTAAFPSRTDCTSEASAVAVGSPSAVLPSPCPLVELLGTCPSGEEVLRTFPSRAASPCSFVVQLARRLAGLGSIFP